MACWAHSSVSEEEAHAFSSSLSPKDEVCAQPSSQIAKEEAHTSLPPHPYSPRGWGARVLLLLVPEGGGVLASILLGAEGGGAHLHAPPIRPIHHCNFLQLAAGSGQNKIWAEVPLRQPKTPVSPLP